MAVARTTLTILVELGSSFLLVTIDVGKSESLNIIALGYSEEGGLVVSRDISENTSSSSGDVLLNIGFGGKESGRRAGLLGNPVDEILGSSTTIVLDGFARSEELESRVASNAEFLSEGALGCGINLGELDSRARFFQLSGGRTLDVRSTAVKAHVRVLRG